MDTMLQKLIRIIVREEIERRFPLPQTATQIWPCSACGIDFGGTVPMSYHCSRSDCPTYSNITAGR